MALISRDELLSSCGSQPWRIVGYEVRRGYGELHVIDGGGERREFGGLLFSRLPSGPSVEVVGTSEGMRFSDGAGEFATGGVSAPVASDLWGRL